MSRVGDEGNAVEVHAAIPGVGVRWVQSGGTDFSATNVSAHRLPARATVPTGGSNRL